MLAIIRSAVTNREEVELSIISLYLKSLISFDSIKLSDYYIFKILFVLGMKSMKQMYQFCASVLKHKKRNLLEYSTISILNVYIYLFNFKILNKIPNIKLCDTNLIEFVYNNIDNSTAINSYLASVYYDLNITNDSLEYYYETMKRSTSVTESSNPNLFKYRKYYRSGIISDSKRVKPPKHTKSTSVELIYLHYNNSMYINMVKIYNILHYYELIESRSSDDLSILFSRCVIEDDVFNTHSDISLIRKDLSSIFS